MNNVEERRLLLVAGGTGGHIWPAVSFGRWLAKNKPDVHIEYACGSRPLELEIYKAADISPHVFPVDGSPLSGDAVQKIKRIRGQFSAFSDARELLRKIKPGCCALFGGYISMPLLLACKTSKTPCVMHEQNAYAGKVTRLAAKLGTEIFTGWPECAPLASGKFTRIGVPVREFEKYAPERAWRELGLPGEMPLGPKLVVFSGSLGSQSIKDVICSVSRMEEFKNWSFILPAVSESCVRVGENVYLLPKVWNASLLFGLADMAVVRAGGSTLTEIGTLGIPSIVIPWRAAADDHQYHNAISFIAENTAIMADDNANPDGFAKKLLKLRAILDEKRQITTSKLYNNAGRICGDFWLALSSYF